MYNFRGIIYDIQPISGSENLEVIIDLSSVKLLVEDSYLMESVSLEDYMSKVRTLSSDIEDLGKEIFNYDKSVYFVYYSGETTEDNLVGLIGFGVYHKVYKSHNFKYFNAFNPIELQRELKINSILDSDKFGEDE